MVQSSACQCLYLWVTAPALLGMGLEASMLEDAAWEIRGVADRCWVGKAQELRAGGFKRGFLQA